MARADGARKRKRDVRRSAEDSDTSQASESAGGASLAEENARLKEELRASRQTLNEIARECSCGICMEVFDQPCALAPCGHVFCAPCLVSWFSVAANRENEEDNEEQTVKRRRKKVCPACRAHVSTPPLGLWSLKNMLLKLQEGSLSQRTKSTPVSQEHWDNLFDPITFYHVIRDEQDGVLRCGVCSSEILDGQCSNPECGIIYEDLDDGMGGGDAIGFSEEESRSGSEDEGESLDDFVVGDDVVEDEASSSVQSASPPPRRGSRQPPRRRRSQIVDDEAEEDEGDSEGDFRAESGDEESEEDEGEEPEEEEEEEVSDAVDEILEAPEDGSEESEPSDSSSGAAQHQTARNSRQSRLLDLLASRQRRQNARPSQAYHGDSDDSDGIEIVDKPGSDASASD